MLESILGPLHGAAARVGTRMNPWRIEGLDPIPADAPDHVLLHGELGTGGIVSMHFAYVPVQPAGFHLDVFGDRAIVRASAMGVGHVAPMKLEIGHAGTSQLEPLSVPERYVEVPDSVPHGAPFHVAHNYRRFARCILNGESAAPTFADGVQRLRSLAALG
jgi:predicted dehydrogenase